MKKIGEIMLSGCFGQIDVYVNKDGIFWIQAINFAGNIDFRDLETQYNDICRKYRKEQQNEPNFR